jgi:hypothetical protein
MSKFKTVIRDAVAVLVTTALAILAEHYVSIQLTWIVAIGGLLVLLYLHELHTPVGSWLLSIWVHHRAAAVSAISVFALVGISLAANHRFQLPRDPKAKAAPNPDWASKQHYDTHIDRSPSTALLKDTLVINALAGNGNYVEGSKIGSIDPITWKSYYSEVTVIFVNTSSEDYDAFDVSIDPDQVIFAVSQVTVVPGVSIFSPTGGPGTQLPAEQTGPLPPGRVLLLPNNVDSSPRRLRCEKFPSKLPMRVILAVANVRFPREAKHGHALIFGYGLPDLNPKTLPKWVKIEGSYKLHGRTLHVSKTVKFAQSATP